MRFDLAEGFPVVTTKKLHLRSIIGELLWFLRGDTNVRWLQERGSRSGTSGPTSSATSGRSTATSGGRGRPRRRQVDQIAKVVEARSARTPTRAGIVSAWNVADVDEMALPPCHTLFQFYVAASDGGAHLDCQLYQRWADVFLGVPFNIASYALLTMMVAQVTGLRPATSCTPSATRTSTRTTSSRRGSSARARRAPTDDAYHPEARHRRLRPRGLRLVGYEVPPVHQGADRGLKEAR